MKIINSLFQNNSALGIFNQNGGGGAIYCEGENDFIEQCTFINNTALENYGGAIRLGTGSFMINNNIFINNSALFGNHIFASNFESFNNNIFYINSFTEINASAKGDDILKLFDNNSFIINGTIISKDELYPKSKTFSDIIKIINNAKIGDSIKLSGFYYGNGEIITINKRITIIGDDNTTLDANYSSNIIFYIDSSNVIIDNLKLINCRNKYDPGAIYWHGDNGILSNCILKNNSGNKYGGGVVWWGSNGAIINCTFENNSINRYGGAIYINGDGTRVINSLFINNTIFGNNNGLVGGGAIYVDGENQIIENCTFINNIAVNSFGGAIKLGSGSWSINSNIFINNSALIGNNIYAGNFSAFKGNIFYMNSISDINTSAHGDDILKLFDNNIFSFSGKIISREDYFPIIKNFSDIINLINNATEGQIIKIKGHYYGNGDIITINKMVDIIGENNTILDANGSSKIFYIKSSNVTIDNLKIINCHSNNEGGAIYWNGSNGLLSNCVIENNNGFKIGGGVEWRGSNGKIINCTFRNNSVERYGGAIYTNGDSMKIINSIFKNNSVLGISSDWFGGGAIYSDRVYQTIENCTFINNSAPNNSGGAIKISDFMWPIKNNIFINNYALKGNNIYATNFKSFNDNTFYMNSISDINASAHGDNILKLFDNNNTFIAYGSVISKKYFCGNRTFSDIINFINNSNEGYTIKLNGYHYADVGQITVKKTINIIGDDNTTLDAKNYGKIFEIYSPNVVIDNLKMINSRNYDSGAIWWDGAGGILSNCILENNEGHSSGGAIIWWGANGKIINCTFDNNRVKYYKSYGGAVYMNGRNMKIINSLFINNYMLGLFDKLEGGGAIFGNGINQIIENCTFINNSAPKSWGGAVKLSAGQGTIGSFSVNFNKFYNNSAVLGNNIYTENFDIFSGNIFYMDSISDINHSAYGDDILKLFDKNVFIVNDTIVTKDDFTQKF